MYVNGVLLGTGNHWNQSGSYSASLQSGTNVIAIKGIDTGGAAAVLAELTVTDSSGVQRMGTSSQWKVSTTAPADWTDVGFDDSLWTDATQYGSYGVGPWYQRVSGMPSDTPGQWIWSSDNAADNTVFLRYSFIIGP